MIHSVRRCMVTCALAACALYLPLDAKAQADPRQILAGVIQQLQTGTPNITWYGPQLWQTIAAQTGNSGRYPQLTALGPVNNVQLTQQQQFPQGSLFELVAQHAQGRSMWQLGVSSISNRIEYANFKIDNTPLPPGTPNPAPAPTPTPAPAPSTSCEKFPNLC